MTDKTSVTFTVEGGNQGLRDLAAHINHELFRLKGVLFFAESDPGDAIHKTLTNLTALLDAISLEAEPQSVEEQYLNSDYYKRTGQSWKAMMSQ